MTVKKRSITLTFDTMAVTADNKAEVADWCGGMVVRDGNLLVPVPGARGGWKIADPGDLVVTAAGDQFDVVPFDKLDGWQEVATKLVKS